MSQLSQNELEKPFSEYIYHGISTSLPKFLGIVNTPYGIMSEERARVSDVPRLQSHLAATGGRDLVSFAVYGTAAFRKYILPGISFIIDPEHPGLEIVEGSTRGALAGEGYVRDHIPLSAIVAVWVPSGLANSRLGEIDLCDLGYGTLPTSAAELEPRLRYVLGDREPVTTQLLEVFSELNDDLTERMQERQRKLQGRAYRSMNPSQRRQVREEMERDFSEELRNILRNLGRDCGEEWLRSVVEANEGMIELEDLMNLRVRDFLQGVLASRLPGVLIITDDE